MPQVAQVQVCLSHAFAVVGHYDFLLAALLDLHLDTGCASVYGVLQKLLDCRCRSLNYLACGDFIDDLIGQNVYFGGFHDQNIAIFCFFCFFYYIA